MNPTPSTTTITTTTTNNKSKYWNIAPGKSAVGSLFPGLWRSPALPPRALGPGPPPHAALFVPLQTLWKNTGSSASSARMLLGGWSLFCIMCSHTIESLHNKDNLLVSPCAGNPKAMTPHGRRSEIVTEKETQPRARAGQKHRRAEKGGVWRRPLPPEAHVGLLICSPHDGAGPRSSYSPI